jgi:hypothetical protein
MGPAPPPRPRSAGSAWLAWRRACESCARGAAEGPLVSAGGAPFRAPDEKVSPEREPPLRDAQRRTHGRAVLSAPCTLHSAVQACGVGRVTNTHRLGRDVGRGNVGPQQLQGRVQSTARRDTASRRGQRWPVMLCSWAATQRAHRTGRQVHSAAGPRSCAVAAAGRPRRRRPAATRTRRRCSPGARGAGEHCGACGPAPGRP